MTQKRASELASQAVDGGDNTSTVEAKHDGVGSEFRSRSHNAAVNIIDGDISSNLVGSAAGNHGVAGQERDRELSAGISVEAGNVAQHSAVRQLIDKAEGVEAIAIVEHFFPSAALDVDRLQLAVEVDVQLGDLQAVNNLDNGRLGNASRNKAGGLAGLPEDIAAVQVDDGDDVVAVSNDLRVGRVQSCLLFGSR